MPVKLVYLSLQQFIDSISLYAPSTFFRDVTHSGYTNGGDWYVVDGSRQTSPNPILNIQERLHLKFHQIKVYLQHNLIWNYFKRAD